MTDKTERERFEAWARTQSDDWLDSKDAWLTWQARAALSQPAEAPRLYSPIEANPHAQRDGRHVNDNEPHDEASGPYLDARGDDRGQGLMAAQGLGIVRGPAFELYASAAAAQAVPQGWHGLTEAERDKAVGSICEYGTGFVAPLYAVVGDIERRLQQRNAPNTEAGDGAQN